jgi:hypothetical protein
MARIVWRVWAISAAVAGGLVAADKPADLPIRSEVNGRSTPAITQDHHQPEAAPVPRLLPTPILQAPRSREFVESVIGLQQPGVPTPDLDIPIRATSFGQRNWSGAGPDDWKARSVLEVAELHFRSCDAEEARKWYREVIKLAPGTVYAKLANERLDQTNILPAGATESREPPLADAAGDIKELQIRVLWEAARQYKAAVDSGDRLEIGKCARGLEAALKHTRPAELPGSIR